MSSGSDGLTAKDQTGEIVCSPAEHSIRIHRWKVREGFQVTRNHIILLYSVPDEQSGGTDSNGPCAAADLKRLKVPQTGVVRKRLFKDGDTVGKGLPLLELGPCIHTTVIKDMCADCGADLRQDESMAAGAAAGGTETASVPMIHSVPELKVTQQLAQKLGKADTRRLLEDRKLVLLVDLDQTVIHTTNDNVPNNVRDVYHFQLYGPHSPWYHTRLRPGTFRFLSRMAELYELHICTFGARNYAHKIAQFLDADGKYFSHRILSRDECFNLTSKTDNLKALFPCGDSMVCIIDDREDVWNMASNLIQVKPYHFFQHTGDINAPPGMAKHELDGKGMNFKDLLKPDAGTEKVKSASDVPDTNSTTTSTIPVKADTGNNQSPKATKTNDDKGSETATPKVTKPSTGGPDNMIDVEDPDDYLLYLETILRQIHKRFYKHYDENKSIPDLKQLVPKIRGEILRGQTLVFSGLVPNQQRLEVSKAFVIARRMGANVKQQLTDDTTHLVAATSGTFKVNAARKRPEIRVVTPEWLWSCAERWECVEERLFPLDPLRPSKMRQPPPHCHSPEHATNYNDSGDSDPSATAKRSAHSSQKYAQPMAGPSGAASTTTNSAANEDDDDSNSGGPKFMDTINPLLSFTTDDLADMNQEFDQFFESDDDSSTSNDDERTDMENPPSDKKLKKRRRHEEEREQRTKPVKMPTTTSTMADVSPHKKPRTRDVVASSPDAMDNDEAATAANTGSSDGIRFNDNDDDVAKSDADDNEDDDDEETISSRFRRGADLPSDIDMGSNCGSGASADTGDEDDGDWSSMGAALEREFLGLE